MNRVSFLSRLAFAALLACLSVSASAQTYMYSRTIGAYSSGTGLNLPAGVVVDNSGNIYVGDYNGYRAVKYSAAGTYLYPFLTSGITWIAAVDNNGYVYVSDGGTNRVIKYNSGAGSPQYFGPSVSLTPTVNLNGPCGGAVDNSGNLYIADSNNNRVVKFKPSGQATQIFGSAAPLGLSGPRSVALDSSGNIYVSDFGNHRVVEFNSSGGFVRTFGSYGSGNGQIINPRGAALDGSGNVYAADANGRVVEFTNNGIFVQNIGTPGSSDGQLTIPRGIAIDSAGNLYVADAYNNRVLEFSQSVFSGTVTLEGANDAAQNITFTFQLEGSGTRFTQKQVLKPTQIGGNSGTFAFSNIPPGTYDVEIKGFCWLQTVWLGVVIGNGVTEVDPYLLGSDINNDNSVDSADFGMLIGDYGNFGASL